MDNLMLASSPHIVRGISTRRIMLDVVISLLPAAIAGVIIFGLRALWLELICVAACVASEALFNLAVHKKQTIGDCSAMVTGLLLALNLPANLPLWQAVVGSVFAIVVVKCLFGGLGHNLVNPAITARVFMLVAFGTMAKAAFPVDAVASATPLAQLAAGEKPELLTLFLGNYGGAIGETCTPALLLGGIYLLARRVITWQLPTVYIGTVFVLSFALTGWDAVAALAGILSGGLFIGAFFMATDYVTSPDTPWGKVVFGLLAGVLTVLIRFYGNYPEGVSFAILLMNILTPYIDVWTARKPFGGVKA